jgi:ATP phosphoribosyltransferase
MNLRVALPKGRLLKPTAELLEKAGWALSDYSDKARLYRLTSSRFPGLGVKMFQEKDIPIQVAIGNYDLGVCGLDWVEEQLVKFPSSSIVKLKDLGYGEGGVFVAAAASRLADGMLTTQNSRVRIAGEYPNLAERLAEQLRLTRFSIYPLWGAAEGYPPENAELVLLSRKNEEDVARGGLMSLGRLVDFRACLIANADSLKTKDMAELLASLELSAAAPPSGSTTCLSPVETVSGDFAADADVVRLGLPDGHQQSHVRKILDAAGIGIEDYPSETGNRCPGGLPGFFIKVVRPQDMPLQVASDNFDLAITGRDWLTDHLYQFPTSPVRDLLDLKYGWVRIVAVVDNTVPVENLAELREYCHRAPAPYRVASEYVNIADYYARANQLGQYRIIPTWGATEAFLPEDADLLIENTETGSTIARHNLKIIDTLFESTACVVGREQEMTPLKRQRISWLLEKLKSALETMS